MKRIAVAISALIVFGSAQAQLQLNPRGNPPAAPAAKPKPALQGAQRTQYILKQLELKPDQRKHADALIETYYSGNNPDKSIDIDQIRQIAKDMENAQKANNTALYNELQEKLKAIGQGSSDEPEFIENMKKVLTEEQKTELSDTLDRLKANPSGSLRAIDVLHSARKLKLNDKQSSDLDTATAAFRTKINDPAAAKDSTPPEVKQATQLDEFIASVRAILTPEQAPKFDARIAVLRPDTTPEKPATP